MKDFLRPEEVLEKVPLKEGSTVAEFGCGTGKFVLALAKRLPQGKVYGIDVQKKRLQILRRDAERQGIYNIELIRGDLEKKGGSTLGPGSLDFVFIPNVLFQVEKKEAVLSEAKRVLKKGGNLLIIDWEKESALAPKEGWPLSAREAKQAASEQEFEFERGLEVGAFHFALLFKKPA